MTDGVLVLVSGQAKRCFAFAFVKSLHRAGYGCDALFKLQLGCAISRIPKAADIEGLMLQDVSDTETP